MSVQCIPLIPHFFYGKKLVYMGIPIFRISDPKQGLWVFFKIVSAKRFLRVPTFYILSKNK